MEQLLEFTNKPYLYSKKINNNKSLLTSRPTK